MGFVNPSKSQIIGDGVGLAVVLIAPGAFVTVIVGILLAGTRQTIEPSK